MCQLGANESTWAGYRISSSRSPRTPNRGKQTVNRRPQIEHIMWGCRSAWSPLWWWPCRNSWQPSKDGIQPILSYCLVIYLEIVSKCVWPSSNGVAFRTVPPIGGLSCVFIPIPQLRYLQHSDTVSAIKVSFASGILQTISSAIISWHGIQVLVSHGHGMTLNRHYQLIILPHDINSATRIEIVVLI